MNSDTIPLVVPPASASEAERRFAESLGVAAGGEWQIRRGVPLSEIVGPGGTFPAQPAAGRVDFLLTAQGATTPVLAIVLDDPAAAARSAERAAQLEAALQPVGLPLLRVQVAPSYDVAALAAQIKAKIRTGIHFQDTDQFYKDTAPLPRPQPAPVLAVDIPATPAPAPVPSVQPGKRRFRFRPGPPGKLRKRAYRLLFRLGVIVLGVALVLGVIANARRAAPLLSGIGINLPDLPTISLPTISLPTITLPDIRLPEIHWPDIRLPEINVPRPGIPATINAPNLNLRSGPGVEFESLGSYEKGTRLRVIGRDETATWLEVETPDGKVGWMSGGYLALDGPLDSAPLVTPSPAP